MSHSLADKHTAAVESICNQLRGCCKSAACDCPVIKGSSTFLTFCALHIRRQGTYCSSLLEKSSYCCSPDHTTTAETSVKAGNSHGGPQRCTQTGLLKHISARQGHGLRSPELESFGAIALAFRTPGLQQNQTGKQGTSSKSAT